MLKLPDRQHLGDKESRPLCFCECRHETRELAVQGTKVCAKRRQVKGVSSTTAILIKLSGNASISRTESVDKETSRAKRNHTRNHTRLWDEHRVRGGAVTTLNSIKHRSFVYTACKRKVGIFGIACFGTVLVKKKTKVANYF